MTSQNKLARQPSVATNTMPPSHHTTARQEAALWRSQTERHALTGEVVIRIRYPTRSDEVRTVMIANEDRADTRKIIRLLDSYDAAYPTSESYSFVADLIRQAEKRRLIATSCPGFVEEGRGFVMPTKQFGRAKQRYAWAEATSGDFFDQRSGCLATYQQYVLEPALHSSVATLAVLLPLASSLLSYARERFKIKLVPETGIFHIVGPTTCGKTTCARLCVACPLKSGPP